MIPSPSHQIGDAKTEDRSLHWRVLGGNNKHRIGMNSGLCVYQEKNPLGEVETKRLLFDMGVMSGDPRYPEHASLKDSDTIFIDYARHFYKKNDAQYVPNEPVDAIFLTHSHSDHIGALPFLALLGYRLPPIYATPYTAKRLEQEFSNMGLGPAEWPQIIQIAPGMTVSQGPVRVSPFWVSHSTPQSVGFFIETPEGNILNPGDFKMDQSIVWGPAFDETQFKKMIAGKKIDLMLMDSTGADRDIVPTTEHDVRESLREIIEKYPSKRFVVAVMSGFEENVASLAKVAAEYDRTLWVSGWSHEQSLSALKETGLSLSDSIGSPVDVRSLSTPRMARELEESAARTSVVLVTGAQGSPNAALTKAADGHHPFLTLDPATDIVLFCAPVIPGQEGQHARLLKSLKDRGIRVLTRQDATLYSQAHARLPELIEMVKLVNPRNVLPVHGDQHLRKAGYDAIEKLGYPCIAVENGDTLHVQKTKVQKTEEVTTPSLIGLKTLQGKSWSDRHYLMTKTETPPVTQDNSPQQSKKPKIYNLGG